MRLILLVGKDVGKEILLQPATKIENLKGITG